MDLKHWVMLAIQVSLFTTVFGFGLKATLGDVLYLVRHPSLLVRSLIAMFVIMPLVAVALVHVFKLPPVLEVSLVALSIAPLPPLIPKKLAKAGGHANFGIALMATVAVLAVVLVPLSAELLGRFFNQPFNISAVAVAVLVIKSALLPLALGLLVHAMLPALADRIEQPLALIGKILLPLGVVVLVGAALPTLWGLVGDGTLLALVGFVVIGIAVGHLLGGPEPDNRLVLALSSACRHPAIALSLATASFPAERFGPMILLYLLVSAIAGIPYTRWQKGNVSKAEPLTGA